MFLNENAVVGTLSGTMNLIKNIALWVVIAFGAGYLIGTVNSENECSSPPYTEQR